jgi:hypothetical protein
LQAYLQPVVASRHALNRQFLKQKFDAALNLAKIFARCVGFSPASKLRATATPFGPCLSDKWIMASQTRNVTATIVINNAANFFRHPA